MRIDQQKDKLVFREIVHDKQYFRDVYTNWIGLLKIASTGKFSIKSQEPQIQELYSHLNMGYGTVITHLEELKII